MGNAHLIGHLMAILIFLPLGVVALAQAHLWISNLRSKDLPRTDGCTISDGATA